MLETCRKYFFGGKPIIFYFFIFIFWFFGTQLMGFQKLRFLVVLRLCVFVQFFGQDWWINVWEWKTGCLHQKLHNFLPNFFFFSKSIQPKPGLFNLWKRRWHHHDIIKKTIFFCLSILGINAYVGIIIHLLNLDLLGQLLLLLLLLFFWV